MEKRDPHTTDYIYLKKSLMGFLLHEIDRYRFMLHHEENKNLIETFKTNFKKLGESYINSKIIEEQQYY